MRVQNFHERYFCVTGYSRLRVQNFHELGPAFAERDGAFATSRTFDGTSIARESPSNAPSRAQMGDTPTPVTRASTPNVPGGANAPPGTNGYVFMLNHLHLIATSPDVAGFLRDFKRFTSKQLRVLVAT